MERKHFITSAAGLAATMTAGAAFAATPTPGPLPTRGDHRSDHNLRRVYRHLERMIDQLQHDQHDYCGHRVAAIGHLQAARTEVEAGLKCDQTH